MAPRALDDGSEWYVVLEGELHGPIPRRRLAEVLAEHPHGADTALWCAAHDDEWTTVREVVGIAAEAAACRAAQTASAGVPRARPPLPFASSPDPLPTLAPSTSGQLDIGAALRALSAKSPPPLPPRAPPHRTRVPPRASPGRDPRSDWGWRAGGLALGGLAIAFLLEPYFSAGTRPSDDARVLSLPLSEGAADVALAAPSETRLAVAGSPIPAPSEPEAPTLTPPAERAETAEERDEWRRARAERRAREEQLRDETSAQLPDTATADVGGEAMDAVEPETVAVTSPTPELPGVREVSLPVVPPARSIEELISAALPSDDVPSRAPTQAAPVARAVPTEAEVVRALDDVRDSVVACTPAHAVAALRIAVDGSTGRVNSVYVDGVFAGTPVGSCIARAVRRARVAPFTEPSFTLSYPFRL